MKLVRLGSDGFPQLGVVAGNAVVRIRSFASMLDIIAAGADGLDRIRAEISVSNDRTALVAAVVISPADGKCPAQA